jgi:hypothetical protein
MMTYCPVVLTTNDGNVAAQVAISQRINGEIRHAVVIRMKGRVTVEKWARACRVRYRQLATHFHSNNNQSCYVEDTDAMMQVRNQAHLLMPNRFLQVKVVLNHLPS